MPHIIIKTRNRACPKARVSLRTGNKCSVAYCIYHAPCCAILLAAVVRFPFKGVIPRALHLKRHILDWSGTQQYTAAFERGNRVSIALDRIVRVCN